MFENLRNRIELAKAQLTGTQIRVDSAIRQLKHDASYNSLVSRAEHEHGSTMAEAFISESMHFLEGNPTAILQPINPSRDQIRLLSYVLDSVDDGTMQLEETNGRVSAKDQPFVVKSYSTQKKENDTRGRVGIEERFSDLLSQKDARVVVRWGVHEPFPHGFSIFGNLGMAHPGTIDFMTFPEQPMTSEDANRTLQIPSEEDGVKQTLSVFDKGKRIIMTRGAMYKGQEMHMTHQYYFIGTFDGEQTGKTYYMYASNDDHNKMTVKQTVGERKLATQSTSK